MILFRLIAPNAFIHATAPVFYAADSLASVIHSFSNSLRDTAELAAQNEQLTSANAALVAENEALKKKEARLDELGSGGTVAAVVMRPPESPYDTLLVAGGVRAGITSGEEAFAAGNVPIGIVTSVTADFARITLFSSAGMRTYGWVGSMHTPLTLSGSGGGTMSASLSRSVPIEVGDTVFAPGPGMLPIGKVVRVDSTPLSPSVTLRLQLNTNIFSLGWVQVRDVGRAVLNSFSATSTELQ